MRLHDLEEIRPLVRAGAGARREAVFYSPWRREWRPLRGILHSCCTFVSGARLFEALLRASEGPRPRLPLPAARRAWLARRLAEEMGDLAHGLRSLARARRAGLLAPAGARLARAVARERAHLSGALRRRLRELRRTAEGRTHLRAAARHEQDVAASPVRWRWEVPEESAARIR